MLRRFCKELGRETGPFFLQNRLLSDVSSTDIRRARIDEKRRQSAKERPISRAASIGAESIRIRRDWHAPERRAPQVHWDRANRRRSLCPSRF